MRRTIHDDYGNAITLHPQADFDSMQKAGTLAAQTLDYITPFVREGVTTNTLNDLCHDYIVKHKAIPAPLNYRGFPKSICTSLNHVICHGIPNDRKLQEGDILNIDVTVILDGWYGDTSRMFCVGKVGLRAKKLIEVTYDAMMMAIEKVRPGCTLGDIGHTIQAYGESHGFSIVQEFCGHGLGQEFHTAPEVLHYGRAGEGFVLEEGMFFTIEPMINAGKPHMRILADEWTAVTRDKSLSAQFEHSLGVTADGFQIFTLSPKGWTRPPYNE